MRKPGASRPIRTLKHVATGGEGTMRGRAESLLDARRRRSSPAASPTTLLESQGLIHELQVHQVELELQNVELHQTRDQLEALLENFTNLYDFAPVGYFSLTAAGVITQVNLTGAELLGAERSRLIGRPFGPLVAPEMRADFHSFLRKALASASRATSDFALERRGQPRRIVSLEVQPVLQGEQCRVVAVDITERSRAEKVQRRLEVVLATNRKLESEVSRRKASEKALRLSRSHQARLLREYQRLHRQLMRLPRLILSAEEEERKRISRELHDVIAQSLTGVKLSMEYLGAMTGQDAGRLRDELRRADRLLREAVDAVHKFAVELRPTVLDDVGLVPALRTFLRDLSTRTGIQTRLSLRSFSDQLAPIRRTVLFRVAQEALNNAARHSGATEVEVSLRGSDAWIHMRIRDNGKAFNVERALKATTGRRLGLLGMRERVEMVGGVLGIESVSGDGTTVTARIPEAELADDKVLGQS